MRYTTEIFRPDNTFGQLRALRNAFPGVDVFEYLRKDVRNPEPSAAQDALYNHIYQELGYENGAANLAYEMANEQARGAINRMVEELGLDTDLFSLRNEVSLISSIDRVLTMAPYSDSRLRFELTRHMLLGELALHLLPRRSAQQNIPIDAQIALNNDLFTNYGELEDISLYAMHDPNSNAVTKIVTHSDEASKHDCMREHRFEARRTSDDLLINTHARQKDPETSILKTLRKALGSSSGLLDLDLVMGDQVGISHVILGRLSSCGNLQIATDDDIRSYKSTVIETLLNRFPNSSVEEDNKTTFDTEGYRFDRVKMYIPDHPGPLEIFFYTPEQHLDARYAVGKANKGIYNGSAHELHRIRRLIDLQPILFPECIYPKEEFYNAVQAKQRSVVEELKSH